MKHIFLIALISFCTSLQAANIDKPYKRISPSVKSSISVSKKPVTYKEKQQLKKDIASGKKLCYRGLDRKTKSYYVVCK